MSIWKRIDWSIFFGYLLILIVLFLFWYFVIKWFVELIARWQ